MNGEELWRVEHVLMREDVLVSQAEVTAGRFI